MREAGGDVLSEANTVSAVGIMTGSCEMKPRVESTGLVGEVEMVIDCMLAPVTLFDASSFIWVALPVREFESEVDRDVALDLKLPSNDHPIIELVCILGTEFWASCVVKVLEAAPSEALSVVCAVGEIELDGKTEEGAPEEVWVDVAEPAADDINSESVVPPNCCESVELFQIGTVRLCDGVQSSIMESWFAAEVFTVGACTLIVKHTGAASWQNTVRLRGPTMAALFNDKEKEYCASGEEQPAGTAESNVELLSENCSSAPVQLDDETVKLLTWPAAILRACFRHVPLSSPLVADSAAACM